MKIGIQITFEKGSDDMVSMIVEGESAEVVSNKICDHILERAFGQYLDISEIPPVWRIIRYATVQDIIVTEGEQQ